MIFNIFQKKIIFYFFFLILLFNNPLSAQNKSFKFRIIAFYTAKNDLAHISFVHEANKWFPEMAKKYNFLE